MPLTGAKRWILENGAVVSCGLGTAYVLKHFYSNAGPQDLLWMLTPTATLVSWLTGVSFELEPDRGFLSRDLRFEIVPACSGVNFLIVVFSSLLCGLVHTKRTLVGKAGFALAMAAASYGVALAANATRIAIALPLHTGGATWGRLTPEHLHTVLGAVIYLIFLYAAFDVAAKLVHPERRSHLAVPMVGYVSLTVLAPLLRGAARSNAFWEYAVIPTALAILFAGAGIALRKLPSVRLHVARVRVPLPPTTPLLRFPLLRQASPIATDRRTSRATRKRTTRSAVRSTSGSTLAERRRPHLADF